MIPVTGNEPARTTRAGLLRKAGVAGLGVAGLKSYTVVGGTLQFVVCLFSLGDGPNGPAGALTALIAADRLGQVRTGAGVRYAASDRVRGPSRRKYPAVTGAAPSGRDQRYG